MAEHEPDFWDEAMALIKAAPIGFLATAGSDQPHVRAVTPAYVGVNLYIAAGANSSMVRQITRNPRVELLHWTRDFRHLHITGLASVQPGAQAPDSRRVLPLRARRLLRGRPQRDVVHLHHRAAEFRSPPSPISPPTVGHASGELTASSQTTEGRPHAHRSHRSGPLRSSRLPAARRGWPRDRRRLHPARARGRPPGRAGPGGARRRHCAPAAAPLAAPRRGR